MPEALQAEQQQAQAQDQEAQQGQGEPDQLGEGGRKALDAERRRAAAAERDAKALKAKLDELEQANLSELQKAQKAAADATASASQAQQEALRLRVAVNKGLPASLVDRLRGSTEEEMTADADELLKLVTPQQGVVQPAGPRPDLSQGARGGTAAQGDPAKEFEVFLNKQLNH